MSCPVARRLHVGCVPPVHSFLHKPTHVCAGCRGVLYAQRQYSRMITSRWRRLLSPRDTLAAAALRQEETDGSWHNRPRSEFVTSLSLLSVHACADDCLMRVLVTHETLSLAFSIIYMR